MANPTYIDPAAPFTAPGFTMQPVNYAAQYAQALAQEYPYLSYFADIWNGRNANLYRPVNGKTVMIPSLTVSGDWAVNRDYITGQWQRNWNNEWQAVECKMDREWGTLVDPMDMVESNNIATIANVSRVFNEQQKVPAMDAYAASTLAGFAASFGGVDSTTLTSANILQQWDAALAYMASQRVNRDRLTAYMTPGTYTLLKQAAGITRFIDVGTGIRNIDRNVGGLDGVRIYTVPDDIMKTAFDFDNGWAPAAGAQTISMLLVDPDAVVAPIVYDVSMMSPPTAQSKGKYLYYERYFYDVFALRNRMAGFFAYMAAPALGTLTVTSAAGTASGDTLVTVTGAGVGTYGTSLVYATAASALPQTYGTAPTGGTFKPLVLTNGQANISGLTASQHITVAQVNDQTGGVIASGNAVIVTNS